MNVRDLPLILWVVLMMPLMWLMAFLKSVLNHTPESLAPNRPTLPDEEEVELLLQRFVAVQHTAAAIQNTLKAIEITITKDKLKDPSQGGEGTEPYTKYKPETESPEHGDRRDTGTGDRKPPPRGNRRIRIANDPDGPVNRR